MFEDPQFVDGFILPLDSNCADNGFWDRYLLSYRLLIYAGDVGSPIVE